MTKKKKWIVISAVSGTILLTVELIIGIVFAVTYPWNILYLGFALSEDVPQPTIEYAEFPFEVVCEIDGKKTVFSDVIVCEYDGMGVGSNGKYLKWKGYIKGTDSEYFLVKNSSDIKIYCSVSVPKYYMNDPDNYITGIKPAFYAEGPVATGADEPTLIYIDEHELNNNGIKLISYELSNPVENSFE